MVCGERSGHLILLNEGRRGVGKRVGPREGGGGRESAFGKTET